MVVFVRFSFRFSCWGSVLLVSCENMKGSVCHTRPIGPSDEASQDGQWSDQPTHRSAIGGNRSATEARGGARAKVAQVEDLNSSSLGDDSRIREEEKKCCEDSSAVTSAAELNSGGCDS